jgi:hypothetical protein
LAFFLLAKFFTLKKERKKDQFIFNFFLLILVFDFSHFHRLFFLLSSKREKEREQKNK